MGEDGAAAIASHCLRRHEAGIDGGLVTLELSENRLGAKGAQALVSAFGSSAHHNSTLTHLGLRANDLGEGGAGWLKKLLVRHACLRYLDVSHNRLGTIGLQAICTGVVDQPGRGR